EQKCSNVQDGLIEVFIGGGTPPYTYSLDGDNFQPSPVFQKLAKGNYILTVRDKNNCEKKQAVNVKLSTLISADFEAETGDVYNLVDFFYRVTVLIFINGILVTVLFPESKTHLTNILSIRYTMFN
ncbi:MAG: SprB repeat-containing protein, partial [Bacteroidales bacterium]|nr:SprB repeat-containing protein [Bacteroidales bacterium]